VRSGGEQGTGCSREAHHSPGAKSGKISRRMLDSAPPSPPIPRSQAIRATRGASDGSSQSPEPRSDPHSGAREVHTHGYGEPVGQRKRWRRSATIVEQWGPLLARLVHRATSNPLTTKRFRVARRATRLAQVAAAIWSSVNPSAGATALPGVARAWVLPRCFKPGHGPPIGTRAVVDDVRCWTSSHCRSHRSQLVIRSDGAGAPSSWWRSQPHLMRAHARSELSSQSAILLRSGDRRPARPRRPPLASRLEAHVQVEAPGKTPRPRNSRQGGAPADGLTDARSPPRPAQAGRAVERTRKRFVVSD